MSIWTFYIDGGVIGLQIGTGSDIGSSTTAAGLR